MFRTLKARLLFLFLLLSLGGIIFVSVAIQLGFNDSFRDYRAQKRQDSVNQVIAFIQEEYSQNGVVTGGMPPLLLHQQAMSDHLYYKLYNNNGELILDSTKIAGMMDMMGSMGDGTVDIGKLGMKDYPINVKGTPIGTLKVYYSNNPVNGETQFLNEFNKYIWMAVLMMIFISILASYLLSTWFTKGIREMRRTAKKWQAHQLDARIAPQKMPEEMEQLAKTFNELADSLSYQESLRKQFTSDFAHELRTPLATLRSQLEAFIDGVFEPTNERLCQIHGELMRLVRLVNELEKLMAAENPQLQLQKKWVNAFTIIQEIRQQFEPGFHDKGIRFTIVSSKSNIPLEADIDRFKQIVSNLLNNALKYTPSGGEVAIIVEQNDHGVLLTIKDTGVGISKEDLPHVFERFYRGDKSRDRKTGGIGIGLSIVKALVHAHKGQIEITSELGKGTIVKLILPLS